MLDGDDEDDDANFGMVVTLIYAFECGRTTVLTVRVFGVLVDDEKRRVPVILERRWGGW